MTKVRNQAKVKQVMIRDLGLCRCCGFKAVEVHHVIPIHKGGEDKLNNMVALCSLCHRDAPDSKEEFYEYIKRGGARTLKMLGIIVQEAEKGEFNGGSFSELFTMGRNLLRSLRKIDVENSKEEYNLKDSLDLEDVSFDQVKGMDINI